MIQKSRPSTNFWRTAIERTTFLSSSEPTGDRRGDSPDRQVLLKPIPIDTADPTDDGR
jgi:hypothetical protein